MEYIFNIFMIIWGIFSIINLIKAISIKDFEKWHWISQVFFINIGLILVTINILIFIFEYKF